MVDQEGWQELSNLYLLEGEYAKSAYCMEEMILHNSQNHMYHQRHADIRYTQVLNNILTKTNQNLFYNFLIVF